SKGTRRRGKQPGDPGHHLRRVDDPDVTVIHSPGACRCCGGSLEEAPLTGVESRQVFDIPEPKPFVVDHRVQRRRCSCGAETAGEFPAEAIAPACYGPRLRALAIYMMCRQHLPVERTAELLGDVMGVTVSTGWLSGLVGQAGTALVPFVAHLAGRLRAEAVIGVDETGGRVGVAKHWFHVVTTGRLTLIFAHRRRGMEAVEALGVLPGYGGVIVHDGLALYDGLADATHAQCGAHLLRHLASVGVVWDQTNWTTAMADLLREANTAAREARLAAKSCVTAATAASIASRYDALLDQAFAGLPDGAPPRLRSAGGGWAEHQRQAWNLATRMRNHKPDVLRFLTDTRVPFTNNDSERALRMVKLQQKISGNFASEHGAENFARIRSYLQTAAGHGQNLHDVLTQLFTTGAWLPAGP
ncbi:MAG: IS66 family transposase, partial [Gemmatimonadales bacterium]